MNLIISLLLQRIGLGLLTLVIVSLIIYSAVELLPGDMAEAILGQGATPETLAAFRSEYGLDQPVWQRYVNWVLGAVQGDFGLSFANHRPIADLISERAYNTFFLAGYAAAIAVPFALLLGVMSAILY